ncbi:MAG: toll/interleukin-1 receptor domain-containing protein [Coriobacteriia bacterium]|nr:toll/interleukin-1 receptor domain-containing protein [Coriobacteriia bacterium]
MAKIFISHSSQNAWMLPGLLELIEAVRPGEDPFCSTEIPIESGDNYKETIYRELEGSEFFVAILSQEYWKSRYCILELGAAYHRYCFDAGNKLSIQPMLLPPLEADLALANTPMVELQLADLTDPRTIASFLRQIGGPDAASVVGSLEVRIAEYAASVHKHVLEELSLLARANADAFFEEFPGSTIPRESIVKCQTIDDEQCLLEMHLSELPYEPGFVSVALQYLRKVNLREFLLFDRDAAFAFDVDNVNGLLNRITVELKSGDNHQKYHEVTCELQPGMNSVAVPLPDMNKNPLENTSEICFVVHPREGGDLNAKDGVVIFSNIRVDFTQQNILDIE